MNEKLTDRQRQVLAFIVRSPSVPTYREIARGVGTQSLGYIRSAVLKLVRLGFLKRADKKARSLFVTPKAHEEIQQ
jgi:SOS-response transcriptional repressor LexA